MKCPYPGCEDESDTKRGLKIHHKLKHGETLNIEASLPESHRKKVSEGNKRAWDENRESYTESEEFTNRGAMSNKEKRKRSEACSENAPWKGVGSEDHPWYGREHAEESIEKMSEAAEGHEPRGPNIIHHDELDHIVRSSWEKEVALLLVRAGIEYEYEPEMYDLDGINYYPDFRVGDTIIEVKGYADEHSIEKAQRFIEQYPDITYIVVGDQEMPADIKIQYEERETLIEEMMGRKNRLAP